VPFSRTEPNVPAYEEEQASPFEVTQQSSVTVSPDTPADEVLILPDSTTTNFDRLRVNFQTSGYDTVERDGTVRVSQTSFDIGSGPRQFRIRLRATSNAVLMQVDVSSSLSSDPVAGKNLNTVNSIPQFTLINTAGSDVDARFRVYTLDI